MDGKLRDMLMFNLYFSRWLSTLYAILSDGLYELFILMQDREKKILLTMWKHQIYHLILLGISTPLYVLINFNPIFTPGLDQHYILFVFYYNLLR
jgi:hypothetical protein